MPKSLLLADDSVTIQKAVQMTFKAEDVTLTVVSDGNEALAKAKATKPDLIVADVEMPGVGGYELCEHVRADAALRHIPVLLLGGGTPVDPAKAIAVGANGHIAKPFDSQKLIDQVKQILANPKAMSAAASAAASASARPPMPGASAARPAGASPMSGGPGAVPRPTPARPAAPLSRPPPRPQPGAAPSSTLTMARPPTAPGMRPAGPPTRPPGAPGARPGGAPLSRPPGAVPPGARPPQPGARAPMAPGSRPPAPGALRPPPARLAPPRPAVPRPVPPRPPEETLRRTPPAGADDDLPMEVDEIVEETAASAPPPLRPVPPSTSRHPSLSVVPDGMGAPNDGGEALLREALSKASREVIEKIAWEVVPELAETIIREELERLMKERGA